MTLPLARIEKLAWVLIYGGIAVVCIGFALTREPADYAWAVLCAGGVAVAAGAGCIWLRSRLRDASPSSSTSETP